MTSPQPAELTPDASAPASASSGETLPAASPGSPARGDAASRDPIDNDAAPASRGSSPVGSRDRLPQDLTVAASRFARTMARQADVGVSSVAWRLCSTLHRRGPLRLSEIADAENVTRPTATTAVHRLEEAGLVCRHTDPDDQRSSLIELTPEGLEALRRWTAALGEVARPMLATLTEDELDTLQRATVLLQRLAEAHEHVHLARPDH